MRVSLLMLVIAVAAVAAAVAAAVSGGTPRAVSASTARTTRTFAGASAGRPASMPTATASRRASIPRARTGRPAPVSRAAGSRTKAAPHRPRIISDPISFGARRKAEMVAYVRRHYGSFLKPTWRLVNPRVIVIHYTEASYSSTFNTFADDVPDSELHELPADCAHFVIDANGTIHQLVSLQTMCRHTVGLNWTAIGIEHVGYSDAQVLGDRRQVTASLRLVRWLRCRLGIEVHNVIGHNESLSSPYHHEDVRSLRAQTHSDFTHADMQIYRRRLRSLGGC